MCNVVVAVVGVALCHCRYLGLGLMAGRGRRVTLEFLMADLCASHFEQLSWRISAYRHIGISVLLLLRSRDDMLVEAICRYVTTSISSTISRS